MLIYAPLFSVMSQYLGAEKTGKDTVSIVPRTEFPGLQHTGNALPVVLLLVAVHPDLVTANDGF